MTWTCLRVKANYDAYVAHKLYSSLGKVVRFLTFRGTEKRGNREVPILKPLFPGYLFVRLNPEQEPWTSIAYEYGVIGFLMNGDRPAVVPQHSERDLFAHADDRGIVDLDKRLLSPFQSSVLVRVKSGVFDGHQGIVLSRDARKNVKVLLSVFGGSEVTLAERQLEVV